MTEINLPLAQLVAAATDRAGLGATVPALLLELQAELGVLGGLAVVATDRGRRPFRVEAAWAEAFGRLALGVFVLADQTGLVVDELVRAAVARANAEAVAQPDSTEHDWPFSDG
ncbi:MAG: hypothetical protein ABJA87_00230 [bacterium]